MNFKETHAKTYRPATRAGLVDSTSDIITDIQNSHIFKYIYYSSDDVIKVRVP